MKILSKIHRGTTEQRHQLVEMDLFDTDRNPLEFPSAPPSKVVWSALAPDPTFAPWTGPNPREIVIPWPQLSGDTAIAELTSDHRINLLETGIYLVQFEGGFTVGYNGGSTEPNWGLYGSLIGYDETTAGGPILTRFARDERYPEVQPLNLPTPFNLVAPVVVHSAPKPILTAIFAYATLESGQNIVLTPDQMDHGWPNAPLQLNIIKLPGLVSGMVGDGFQ